MIDPKRDRMAVAADWETFYDSKNGYSLTSMSTQQYCADPRFDPYLVALCGFDIFEPEDQWEKGTVHRTLGDGRQLYIGRGEKFHGWGNLDNRIICCHNCSFDSIVFEECWRRGILPRINNPEWECTADLSSYLLAPRNLKGAMKYLFGKEISKAVRAAMDGKHDYELDAHDYRDLVEYGGSDAVECHDLWLEYSAEWPEVERKISVQNRESIRRGVLVDREYAENALRELESYQARVLCEVPWTSEVNPKTGEFYKAGSLPALRQAVIDLGIKPPKSFKKDDPGFLDWLKDNDGIPFIKARQTAVAVAMHVARIKGILSSLDDRGNAHPSFLYFGAHTGRFSGKSDASGTNINMLNMPRKPVFSGDSNVFDGKGVDIRGMYVPKPGHKFAVFDYSQIEARFALDFVGDDHMMAALKKEGNLYQANAVAMGWCKSGANIKHDSPDVYRLAKCCLCSDTLVLIRSERKNGTLTSPYYKSIIHVTPTDRVWDGHEWVRHLGVEKMKEVHENELVEVGGVRLTGDHKVYVSETESRRADTLLKDEEATAMAWGQAQNPVQGWAYVRILASALIRVGARAFCLAAREALYLLAGALHLRGVRGEGEPVVGQCPDRKNDKVQVMCAEDRGEETPVERVGEDAR